MSIPQVSSKLPQVGTTIFTVIGDLAARHPSINLSQGAPSFPCGPELIRGTHEAMLAGENQYAPMTGLPALREQLVAKIAASYGHHYDAGEEITITASASEALFCAITALVHPGDEVIMFEPAFDSYRPMIQLQGATPVVIPLKAPDFAIPWDEVAAHITPRTAARASVSLIVHSVVASIVRSRSFVHGKKKNNGKKRACAPFCV